MMGGNKTFHDIVLIYSVLTVKGLIMRLGMQFVT